MAQRAASWAEIEGVGKDAIEALTFSEQPVNELTFRIWRWIQIVTLLRRELFAGWDVPRLFITQT